ncbi:hypothetical protein [Bradyrhizobium sp.]|uniref:hypothetical protein n=1 Tax=Bradyrhizobium sp. TaxID=376 RepID=UPI0025C0ABBC|nr:hypothetical protein [Bradyrhizobium sp.]
MRRRSSQTRRPPKGRPDSKENLSNFDHIEKVVAYSSLFATRLAMRHSGGTSLQTKTFLMDALSCRNRAYINLECTMNIFYIIGVIVVILLVAGFLGLR